MKTLLSTAAVVAVAVSTMSYLAVPAQAAHARHARHVAHAAPAKSAYCGMAKASNNGYAADVSWAAYYGCWGGAPAATAAAYTAPAPAAAAMASASADYCKMAKASNNGYAADVSWAAYYHCWH
jgi:hypothetical protein